MAERAPRLFLIDGSSHIFRAFFALPPSKNSVGLPTHAIFGFANILFKFLKQYQPEYVIVVLDAGRETFRTQLYADYKGNRPQTPADLIAQLPYFRRLLDALRIPLLELAGYEADDIIATLCRHMTDQGCELIVVSSDKDLMQLVADGIKLLDGAKDRWIGAAEVKSKFGVDPSRVVEVMGLMGDAVDNIPGIKGIGSKTAMALIQQFGTLENLFRRLDEVEIMRLRGAARVRALLEANGEVAFLSRALATVKRDVPLAIRLEQLKFTGYDREKTRNLFIELEFTNLMKLLENGRL
jgi:DNA polymerase I